MYPPRDIRPFVMYWVNGKPRSSLLIESIDSMIIIEIVYKCVSVHFVSLVFNIEVQFRINYKIYDVLY